MAERLSFYVIAQVTWDDMTLSEEESEEEGPEENYCYLGPPPVTRGATESMATSLGSFTDSDGEDLLSWRNITVFMTITQRWSTGDSNLLLTFCKIHKCT